MLEASLVILNADVVTLNPNQPKAAAIAVRDEKIVDVGSNQQIRKHVGKQTRVINAKGRTVFPGFVDCHIHMTSFGFSLQYLNLRSVKSVKQLQQKLKKYANDYPEKEWILGGQWDHEQFREKRYPTRWDLDEAVLDKPVFLRRVCGHVAVANTKALQMAGITAETVVEGGKIDFDAKTNQPNGLLREKAVELVEKRIPQPKTQDLEAACLLACEKAVENGLTCVHWLVESREELHVLQKLCFEGKLPLRVYVGIAAKQLENLAKLGVQTGFGSNLLKIGFVKIFADGSLGAHTAALKEPYSDKPETCGILLQTHEKLEELVSKANSAGLQVGIHAIGDRAVEAALKAYEKAQKDNPENTLRHRIEHCSVLNPKLIMQMKRLGIIA
ncbi:MAG: amidohydrolase, partial [Candidatus Bathyarchaeia archaeon]